MVKVSIIIPTLNRQEEINSLLNDLSKQTFKDYELIIVDDASEKPIIQATIRNEKNKGPAISKNIGIKQSKGKYIWFLDSDVRIYNPKVLENMVNYLDNHKVCGSVGGQFLDEDLSLVAAMGIKKNGQSFRDQAKNLYEEVEFIATCNCLATKKVLYEVGGFYPGYFYLGEDKEIGFRIKKAGYKNVVSKQFAVHHLFSSKSNARGYYRAHKTRLIFILRNYNLLKFITLPFYEYEILNIKTVKGKIRSDKNENGILFVITLFLAYFIVYFMALKIFLDKRRYWI